MEKILEEIEQAKREPWYRLSDRGVKSRIDGAIERVIEIVRKHMSGKGMNVHANDGWIPAENPPEPGKRCLVKMKHHAWIADYDSKWVPESEKTYHAEYIEICEAIYHGDGMWSYYDLETGNSEAFVKPKKDKAYPVEEVLEWQYMQQFQPDICKYDGGSCCWPIDQCDDCPKHPERSEGE